MMYMYINNLSLSYSLSHSLPLSLSRSEPLKRHFLTYITSTYMFLLQIKLELHTVKDIFTFKGTDIATFVYILLLVSIYDYILSP